MKSNGQEFSGWSRTVLGTIIVPSTEKVFGDHNYEVLTSSRNGIQRQSEHFAGKQRHDTDGYNIIPRGYCTYRNRSDDGLFTFNMNNIVDEGIVSKFYPVFTFQNANSTFMMEYLNGSPRVRAKLSVLAVGTSQVVLSFETLKETSFYLPSFEEQNRIASMLSSLNERIEKQRTLVENLKKYKRGVIKEFLTPQSCPIKNATWSKSTIGDLGTFIKGAPLSKADISDEGSPFILYGELYTTYGEVINKVVRKTQKKVDDIYLSRIGDVLIPTSGETPEEISTASCVMVSDVILAGDLNIFRTSEVDGRIMSYILNHIVNGNIARIAQGKSVVHIQASEISKISISYPDVPTQQKLIHFFDGISDKILLEEEKLNQMVTLKKSLVQQLFI